MKIETLYDLGEWIQVKTEFRDKTKPELSEPFEITSIDIKIEDGETRVYYGFNNLKGEDTEYSYLESQVGLACWTRRVN
jgi:hypothetical protein